MVFNGYNPLVATLHVSFLTIQNDLIYRPGHYLDETMEKPQLYAPYGMVMNMIAYRAWKGLEAYPDMTPQQLLFDSLRRNEGNPVYREMTLASEQHQTSIKEKIEDCSKQGLCNQDSMILLLYEDNREFAKEIFSGRFKVDGHDFSTLYDAACMTNDYLVQQRRKKLPSPRL